MSLDGEVIGLPYAVNRNRGAGQDAGGAAQVRRRRGQAKGGAGADLDHRSAANAGTQIARGLEQIQRWRPNFCLFVSAFNSIVGVRTQTFGILGGHASSFWHLLATKRDLVRDVAQPRSHAWPDSASRWR